MTTPRRSAPSTPSTPSENGTLGGAEVVLHPVAVLVPGETDARLYLVPGAGSGDFEIAAVLLLAARGAEAVVVVVVESS